MPAPSSRRCPLLFLLFWTVFGLVVHHLPWAIVTGIPLLFIVARTWYSVAVVLTPAILGWCLPLVHPQAPFTAPVQEARMVVQVESLVTTTAKSFRFEAVVLAGTPDNVGRTFRCWIPQDSLRVQPGSILGIEGSLAPPSGPRYPGGFDARSYYQTKNWSGQCYGRSAMILSQSSVLSLSHRMHRWQHRCTERLLRHLHSFAGRQILPALVLGNRMHLEQELRDQFAVAGAMHVLAVSGMHLGLVFAVLRWTMNKSLPVRSRWWKTGLLLLGVWGFALLTGGAASTLRAATLLTAVQIGTTLGRKRTTLNLLAGCAWLQLIWNPWIWQDLGFQLSYAAVTGIVLLEPILRSKREWPRWTKAPTALVRVSFAAQGATTPLALLHFHQFPTYFLVCSLLLVPLASVLLGGGILLLLVADTSLGTALGQLLDGLCNASAALVEWVATLPSARWLVPHWSAADAFAFALVLAAVLAWRKTPTLRNWQLTMLSCMIWGLCVGSWPVGGTLSPSLQLGCDRGQWYGWNFETGQCITSTLPSEELHRIWYQGSGVNFSPILLPETCARINWGANSIAVWDQQEPDSLASIWLVTRANPPPENKKPPAWIVLTDQLYFSQRQAWKTWAAEHHVACHDLRSEGMWTSSVPANRE